jgi:hypothetical protein
VDVKVIWLGCLRHLKERFEEVRHVNHFDWIVRELDSPVLAQNPIDGLEVGSKRSELTLLQIAEGKTVIPRLELQPAEESLLAAVLVHCPSAGQGRDTAWDWLDTLGDLTSRTQRMVLGHGAA